MINPHLVEFTYVQIKDVRTGRKIYAPGYRILGHTVKAKLTRYKQASKALEHSRDFLEGWCQRYDAISDAFTLATAFDLPAPKIEVKS